MNWMPFFFATPHEYSLKWTFAFLNTGIKVFDLSGGFRLKYQESHMKYYRAEYDTSQLPEKTVYGLPEWQAKQIAKVHLIAVPGCYSTANLIALKPVTMNQQIYQHEPFVRLIGRWSKINNVVNTQFADLHWQINEDLHLLVVSYTIDNLLKGAASQAVQCANLTLGLNSSYSLISDMEATQVKQSLVIKIGGSILEKPEALPALFSIIKKLYKQPAIIVHGEGYLIEKILKKEGFLTEKKNNLRIKPKE